MSVMFDSYGYMDPRQEEAMRATGQSVDYGTGGLTYQTTTGGEDTGGSTITYPYKGVEYKSEADRQAAIEADKIAAQLQISGMNAAAVQSQIAAQQAMYGAQQASERTAASAGLKAWLSTFFDPVADADVIQQLMGFVDTQIKSDVPVSAIELNIREQPFYKERFKGNEALRAAGVRELSPAEYLSYEKYAAEYLTSAGLSSLANRSTFASMISNQVSAAELQDRVNNVYMRIRNADQALKDEINRLGELGNVTTSDFAAALLTGKDGADILKRKIATAEVSTEFTQRGLTSALGASDLAGLGVSREQARQGAEYARIGTERLGMLADIYNQEQTGIQAELESEAFKGMASERRKKLTQAERASFAGSAGAAAPSLGSQTIGTF